MTTVDYGDITPINPYEVLVSICLTLFSYCIFANVFNTITSVLKDLDADKSKVKHDLEILSHYMKKRNIDSDLQKRVENYLQLVYKHQPSTQEKKIFSKLSPQLKQELNEQDKGLLLLKQPVLVNNFSLKLLRELIESVQEINLTPQEKLQNDQGLYILLKGNINVIFGENKTVQDQNHYLMSKRIENQVLQVKDFQLFIIYHKVISLKNQKILIQINIIRLEIEL